MDKEKLIEVVRGFVINGGTWSDMIDAILSAIREQGLVIVPEKPTPEMKMAGAKAITEEIMKAKANYDGACDCWSAMISTGREG